MPCPPPGTVAGRSSDREILPEFVADRVGVSQLNFGCGGATAGETNIVGPLFNAPDVAQTGTLRQIDEFETLLGGGRTDARGLYLVFAGSNDLVLVDKNDTAAIGNAIDGAITSLTQAVTRLAGFGAQDVVLATRSPRPVLSDETNVADEADPDARNDAAGRQLSARIRTLVSGLDAFLAANVLLFDAEARIRDIIPGSGTNGFTTYSSDEPHFCINSVDCSTLINYDGADKTSAVRSVLADDFIGQFAADRSADDSDAAACLGPAAGGGDNRVWYGTFAPARRLRPKRPCR